MIAGAAAPGFSPLLGSAFDGLFGWRVTFLVVAAFGVVVALHYAMRIGETHPADCSDRDGKLASDGASRSDRRGSSPPQVARGL